MNKKILIILLVIVLSALIAVKILHNRSAGAGKTGTTSPPTGISAQEHLGTATNLHGQEQEARGRIINKMANKLPYKGTYFSLDYNYKTLSFVLTLQSAYQQQGNQEFDLFLRANSIDDRSWLQPNFQVVVQ